MKFTAATTALFATLLSFSGTAVAQGPGEACYYWDGATYGVSYLLPVLHHLNNFLPPFQVPGSRVQSLQCQTND